MVCKMKAGFIANKLGFEISGNPDEEINKITFAEMAEADNIGIIRNRKQIADTEAKVILAVPGLYNTNKTILYCTCEVNEAAVKIAEFMVKERYYPDYSKHNKYKITENLTQISTGVSLGKDTIIGGFCTISSNVSIGKNCDIGNNVYIGAGTVIGDNVIIRDGAKIASPPFYQYSKRKRCNGFAGIGRVIIGNEVYIGVNSVIQRGTFSDTIICSNNAVGDLVVIGHDVFIGERGLIVTQSGIAGGAILDDDVTVYGQSGIGERIIIEKNAVIQARTSVCKNVAKGKSISGNYGREHIKELKIRAMLDSMLKED